MIYRYLAVVVLLSVIESSSAYGETIYKRVEKSGAVLYSDQAAPGSEVVKLPEAQEFSSQQPKPHLPAKKTDKPPAVATVKEQQTITILQPKAGEHFHNTVGKVPGRLRVTPSLYQGDNIKIFLDGTPALMTASLGFQLTAVNRGQHSVQAKLFDAGGHLRSSSGSVTFYVHQASKLK